MLQDKTVPKGKNGHYTKLASGDIIKFDVEQHKVSILRKGQPLTKVGGGEGYYFMPSDGVEFSEVIELISDATGLVADGVTNDENPTYQFR